MLSLIFAIVMILVFGRLLLFGVRAAWGLLKFLVFVVFLPLILIGLLIGGLIYIAFPLLIVVGIISLIVSLCRR